MRATVSRTLVVPALTAAPPRMELTWSCTDVIVSPTNSRTPESWTGQRGSADFSGRTSRCRRRHAGSCR
ncbi:hypothetical protein C1I92_28070 [Jiangella anatolica]|uniref:Uncharacterized protein n=1 Tax=Jiangella anatolica TaxID=2670374 RepID=A0A2W2BIA5_9ACTN|nr:hypothetical protein C1I92_28070 [Jiangella anatolica]